MENKPTGYESSSDLDWFVKLMKQILKVISCEKQRRILVGSLFDVWEETILGLNEDIHSATSKYMITNYSLLDNYLTFFSVSLILLHKQGQIV